MQTHSLTVHIRMKDGGTRMTAKRFPAPFVHQPLTYGACHRDLGAVEYGRTVYQETSLLHPPSEARQGSRRVSTFITFTTPGANRDKDDYIDDDNGNQQCCQHALASTINFEHLETFFKLAIANPAQSRASQSPRAHQHVGVVVLGR